MKKLLIASLFASISMSAIAVEPTKLVMVDITVTKDGDTVSHSTITAKDGQATPLESSDVQPYIATLRRGRDGILYVTPGKVKTGVLSIVKPEVQLDGTINTSVLIDVTYLSGIMTTDRPALNAAHIDQMLLLTPNEPVTLESGGYTFKVSAASI